jgi:hypothetical protein
LNKFTANLLAQFLKNSVRYATRGRAKRQNESAAIKDHSSKRENVAENVMKRKILNQIMPGI